MVCGVLPFQGKTEKEIKRAICKERLRYPEHIEPLLSKEIKNLIKRMLFKKTDKRIRIDDIYEHPWVTGEKLNKFNKRNTFGRDFGFSNLDENTIIEEEDQGGRRKREINLNKNLNCGSRAGFGPKKRFGGPGLKS
jgi:serine/threonine protein kinase